MFSVTYNTHIKVKYGEHLQVSTTTTNVHDTGSVRLVSGYVTYTKPCYDDDDDEDGDDEKTFFF